MEWGMDSTRIHHHHMSLNKHQDDNEYKRYIAEMNWNNVHYQPNSNPNEIKTQENHFENPHQSVHPSQKNRNWEETNKIYYNNQYHHVNDIIDNNYMDSSYLNNNFDENPLQNGQPQVHELTHRNQYTNNNRSNYRIHEHTINNNKEKYYINEINGVENHTNYDHYRENQMHMETQNRSINHKQLDFKNNEEYIGNKQIEYNNNYSHNMEYQENHLNIENNQNRNVKNRQAEHAPLHMMGKNRAQQSQPMNYKTYNNIEHRNIEKYHDAIDQVERARYDHPTNHPQSNNNLEFIHNQENILPNQKNFSHMKRKRTMTHDTDKFMFYDRFSQRQTGSFSGGPPPTCRGQHRKISSLNISNIIHRDKGYSMKRINRGVGVSPHVLKRLRMQRVEDASIRAIEESRVRAAKLEQYGAFFPKSDDLSLPSISDVMNNELRWRKSLSAPPSAPRYYLKTDVDRALSERKMALQHAYAMIIAEKAQEQLASLQTFNESVCDRQISQFPPSYIS